MPALVLLKLPLKPRQEIEQQRKRESLMESDIFFVCELRQLIRDEILKRIQIYTYIYIYIYVKQN